MDERVKEDLKKRLLNYMEEPDEKLWKRIAPHIAQAPGKPGWTWWAENVSSVLVVLLGLYLYLPLTGENAAALPSQHQNVLQEGNTVSAVGLPPVVIHDKLFQTTIPMVTKDKPAVETKSIENAANVTLLKFKNEEIPVEKFTPEQTVSDIQGTTDFSESELVESVLESKNESEKTMEAQVNKAEKQATMTELKESTSAKKKSAPSWFSLYFTVMPTFGYQRIESNTNDNIIVESIKRIPAFSMDRLGVRAELGMEVPVSKRVKIFGGLLYYQRKQTIGYTERVVDTIMVTPGPDGEVIIETEFSRINQSFEYELKNAGIQVGFNYQLSKKKFLQTLGTGVELQIPLNKLNSNESEGLITKPSAYVFYNLYYRLQYPAEGRLKAVFQPTLNYSFYINQDLNAPFYVKPYGLGLNIGCTYNF